MKTSTSPQKDNATTKPVASRRNFMLSAAALGSGLFASSCAATKEKTVATAPVVKKEPIKSAYPERVRLSCAADPAHMQSFTWRAAGPLEKPQVQIAPLSASPNFENATLTFSAKAKDPFTILGRNQAYNYAFTITDLKPETQYCYRVGDGKKWSEWNIFQTASEKAAPFRFLYVGDIQNDIRSMCSRTMRMAFQHAPDARFIVYAGDLVTEGYSDPLWDEFSYANEVISSMIPALPTPGNHDTHHRTKKMPPYPFNADPAYHGHFELPENGPSDLPALNQEVYYVDYQGVRMISLNSNALEDGTPPKIRNAQLAWLEKVLQNNPNRWTIATHHHPIYSTSKERDNEWLRKQLRPIYDKYQVDLVLQGHDHTYGRTYKLAGDQIVDDSKFGTIYAVSVAGPKMYNSNPKFDSLMPVYFGEKQLFQVISIDGDQLKYESYAVSGERVDGFTLEKGANGISKYTLTI